MSALARQHITGSLARAANDDCINSGSCNRTKYGYDLLDRLTSATTSAITDGWTYDANGNRLTQTGTTAITFTESTTSNQLTATSGGLVRTYGYDAAGNTQSNGAYSFAYNNRGRMASTNGASTLYLYNAFGQMIEKSGTLGTTVLMQDEAGHLIGEYTSTGGLVEETVWLGDTPVATLQPNGSGGVNIFYVHADHLNTPRKVSRPSDNQLEWRWDTDPFGAAAANQNPAGLGTFVYNLRFPGQFYQAETGINQNWNRDYDPAVGRYVESDPIGLGAGINTYAYVDGNPLAYGDPSGLIVPNPFAPIVDYFFPQPWSKERCASILRAINNASRDIERRYALIRTNPLNLPQWGPTSDSPNSASVNGHWREINRLDSQRRKNEDDYDRHCRNNCPPGSPAIDSTQTDLTTPTAGVLGVLLLIGGVLVFL